MAKNNIDNYKLTLKDGRTLSSLDDLHRALKHVSDDVFYFHVNENRNDFYNWVKDVFKDKRLADDLLECSTKEAALFCLQNSLDIKPKTSLMNNAQYNLKLLKELPSLDFGNVLTNDKITDAVKKGYSRVIVKNINQAKPLVTKLNLDSVKKASIKKISNSKVLKSGSSLDLLYANIQKAKLSSPKQIINILKEVHKIE